MKIRFAVAPDSGSSSAAGIGPFAAALDAGGFDGIWLSDVPLAPTLDPLLGLALTAGGRAAAARRQRGSVGRNPFLLAKELAQLDQISRGRLLLSFVTGLGQPGEGEALGLGDRPGAARCSRRCSDYSALLVGRRVRRSPLWTDGRSPASPLSVRPVQDPLEVGSAAAARRRLTGSAGSPTGGSAHR